MGTSCLPAARPQRSRGHCSGEAKSLVGAPYPRMGPLTTRECPAVNSSKTAANEACGNGNERGAVNRKTASGRLRIQRPAEFMAHCRPATAEAFVGIGEGCLSNFMTGTSGEPSLIPIQNCGCEALFGLQSSKPCENCSKPILKWDQPRERLCRNFRGYLTD